MSAVRKQAHIDHKESCIEGIQNGKHTFPNATAVVAISKTKLSPSLAGAATVIGFVPSAD